MLLYHNINYISFCLIDPYVKLSLYEGKKRLKKNKTTVKKCSLNPVYHESFTFKVPSKRIRVNINLHPFVLFHV